MACAVDKVEAIEASLHTGALSLRGYRPWGEKNPLIVDFYDNTEDYIYQQKELLCRLRRNLYI